MNVSPAEPYSNQNKGIAACFALTVQSNARQSSSINPAAPDRIFRKFLKIHRFEQVMIKPGGLCKVIILRLAIAGYGD
jgi:hypothetical protein